MAAVALSDAGRDALGYVGGGILALSLVPQVVKLLLTRSAADISLLWSLLYLLGTVLSLVYLLLIDALAGAIPVIFELAGCLLTLREISQGGFIIGLTATSYAPPSVLATEQQQQQQQQQEQQLLEALRVGPQQQWQSIQAAINAAAAGATILIDQGKYAECLVINKSLTLAAAQQGDTVEVSVNTTQPYQHCLTLQQPNSSSSSSSSSSGGAANPSVVVQGLTFSHYSKSVADNYAVFVQAGSLLLQQCDVSSSSGVGVCVQGAQLQMDGCSIHDCAAHGVAVYGALEGGIGRAKLFCSNISSNKLNGVLARDGAELDMDGCSVQGNGSYGVQLQDCAAVLSGNSLSGNRSGPAAVQLETIEADLQQLQQDNKLDGELQLL
ncbi:hypothetical protein OEZ86_004665 [Tetradesmus obliquus]|nr:hypothetical protein OEZ86_004665 [Tetradesmus obliquus]